MSPHRRLRLLRLPHAAARRRHSFPRRRRPANSSLLRSSPLAAQRSPTPQPVAPSRSDASCPVAVQPSNRTVVVAVHHLQPRPRCPGKRKSHFFSSIFLST